MGPQNKPFATKTPVSVPLEMLPAPSPPPPLVCFPSVYFYNINSLFIFAQVFAQFAVCSKESLSLEDKRLT